MSQYLSSIKEKELTEIATTLISKGKGLLAADESTGRRKMKYSNSENVY